MTFRRVTTTGRELPHNAQALVASFFHSCTSVAKTFGSERRRFYRDRIWNMDETSIYLDCPSKYTYAKQGSKRVKIDTHGGEMVRMSAAFTASADGIKLPILVRHSYFVFIDKASFFGC